MATNRYRYCDSPDHGFTRRGFLGTLGTGLLAGPTLLTDNLLMESAQAAEMKKQAKAA